MPEHRNYNTSVFFEGPKGIKVEDVKESVAQKIIDRALVPVDKAYAIYNKPDIKLAKAIITHLLSSISSILKGAMVEKGQAKEESPSYRR